MNIYNHSDRSILAATTHHDGLSANELIFAEKIKILQKNLFFSVLTSLLCAALIFSQLYFVTNHYEIMGWFLAVVLVSAYRLGTVLYFINKPQYNKFYLSIFLGGVVLTAALWGIVGSFLMPANYYLDQMLIIIIIAGVTAGAIQTLQASLTSTSLYLILSLIPLNIWVYAQPGISYLILGFAVTTFFAFMLVASWRGSQLINQALHLKYENVTLIKDLSGVNKLMLEMLKKLKQRENQLVIINQLNEMLQTSRRSSEAYEIIAAMGEKLFENLNGELAVYDKPTANLITVASWGNHHLLKNRFMPEECWALRSSHVYQVENTRDSLCCHHFESTLPMGYLCVPLIAHNDIVGILHLNSCNGKFPDVPQIATTFSEVIKLSLNNIKLHEELSEQAAHDPLTGLFNRRYLDDRLNHELKRLLKNERLCVSMIDLDNFKTFNDKFGHDAGDEILRYLAKILKNEFRGSDIACRFGGEEFLVVMIHSTIEAAFLKLKNICDEVKNAEIYFQGQILPQVTLSVGVAEAPQHGYKPDQLITAADQALYVAKKKGRNRVEMYLIDEEVATTETVNPD